MATEQILTSQISGFSAGGRVETKLISLSGGSADKTTAAFSFVVGPVMIEITDGSDDSVNVHAMLWANMRSFGGTKTADVTDRKARGTTGASACWCKVDRTTSGTVLNISQVDQGADVNADGTSIGSVLLKNWPNPGRLRVTAWEDTQS
jgi:hypothetical protein